MQAGFTALCFIGGVVSIDPDLPSTEVDQRTDWIGAAWGNNQGETSTWLASIYNYPESLGHDFFKLNWVFRDLSESYKNLIHLRVNCISIYQSNPPKDMPLRK